MALAMVLGSSDEEFEMLVHEMEEKERITTMHAIIAEMDKEQKRFDSLSAQIESMADQASAKFKDISTALVKSQNTLALLMSRNMFCFNLQNNNDSKEEDKSKAIVVKQTKPATASAARRDSSTDKPATKKKVVKVTRVVKTKVITDTDGLDPQLKSIMESRRNNIKNYKKPSEEPITQQVTRSPHVSTSNGHREPMTAEPTGGTPPRTDIDNIPARRGNGHTNGSLDIPSKHLTDDRGSLSDTDTATSSEPSAADLTFDFNSSDFDVEKVKERVLLKSWDPVKILDELYSVRLAKETSPNSADVINMEGYLEQLPVGKQKSTLLKTWKRVYCTAKDGVMYFYKSKNKEAESSSFLSIIGGVLEEMSGRMIGIDDRRGHYLMIRCPSDAEHRDWLRSLYTQLRCSPAATYVRPSINGSPHPSNVLVIDLGSCSVRAGILTTTPCYPQIFMPCVTTNSGGKNVFGGKCYKPENRVNGLQYPIATSKKIDQYRVNVNALHGLFMDICERLAITPSKYTVMLSTPHNFSTRLKQEVLSILFNKMDVQAVNMVNQSLLTPYIYNATSGIVVDIGQRTEIVAITDGYLVDGGLTRLSYGGQRVTDNLNSYLMEYRLFTPAEHLIARLIKEKTCFVSGDYEDDLLECMGDSEQCQATVNLEQFDLPEGAHLKLITVDSARFKAPEGLIKSELLGVDSPTLPQLIQQIVSKCPMDLRREMWQSIYLSGGTTLLEGFPERLEAELNDITPPSVAVKVHASVHRYHAAYIGACMLATLPNFKSSCITRDEWTKHGKSAVSKWKHYFQGA